MDHFKKEQYFLWMSRRTQYELEYMAHLFCDFVMGHRQGILNCALKLELFPM